jgi:hypothetical protein
MTKDQIKDRIPVLWAWLDGKAIQYYRWSDLPAWTDYNFHTAPEILNPGFEFRIKPEPPKPREWWIELSPDNLGIYIHSIYPTQMNGANSLVHVREVLPDEKTGPKN